MNVVFLCAATLGDFEIQSITPFFERRQHTVRACVVDTRPPRSGFERLKKNLRQGRGGYVVVMAGKSLLERRMTAHDTDAFFKSRGVPTLSTGNPYAAGTVAEIERLNADVLLLVNGFGIIKAPLLTVAREGVLSFHHGDMSRYRGQPPAFWELYRGEKEIGLTVQRLTSGLDSGDPIVEKHLEIQPDDTLRSLLARAYAASEDMLHEAVDMLETRRSTDTSYRKQLGTLYTLPNLRQWLAFNIKIGARIGRERMKQMRA